MALLPIGLGIGSDCGDLSQRRILFTQEIRDITQAIAGNRKSGNFIRYHRTLLRQPDTRLGALSMQGARRSDDGCQAFVERIDCLVEITAQSFEAIREGSVESDGKVACREATQTGIQGAERFFRSLLAIVACYSMLLVNGPQPKQAGGGWIDAFRRIFWF
ncbi:hypothetical protein D3C87_1416520 [compost metagenome]